MAKSPKKPEYVPMSGVEAYQGSIARVGFGLAESYNYFAEEGLWKDAADLFNSCIHHMVPPNIRATSLGKKLLDVGIGTGLSAIPFRKYGFDITGVDASAAMLGQCKKAGISNVRLIDLTTEDLPFPDDTFDITISNATLYFLQDTCKTVRDMIRVTKPDGLVVFNFKQATDDTADFETELFKTGIALNEDRSVRAAVETYAHSQTKMLSLLGKYNLTVLEVSGFELYNYDTAPKTPFCQIIARKLA